jgi:hypothetical protein
MYIYNYIYICNYMNLFEIMYIYNYMYIYMCVFNGVLICFNGVCWCLMMFNDV